MYLNKKIFNKNEYRFYNEIDIIIISVKLCIQEHPIEDDLLHNKATL